MAMTFKIADHAVAVYPDGKEKWIAIPAGGTLLDDLIIKEYNDGMLIFAISDKDQRIAIVAPEKTCTKEQHDTLMAEVKDWLDRLQTATYKSAYKNSQATKLGFGGLIVQPAQKSALKDAKAAKTDADAIKKFISDWVKATVFVKPKPDDDDGKKGPGGSDDGKKGPSGDDDGKKGPGGSDDGKKGPGDSGDKKRTPEENFAYGAKLFRDAYGKLKG